MNFHEIIPLTNLRKFDAMCLHNKDLHQNKELQKQILSWAAEMLTEARENWGKLHATTIEAVVAEDRKAQEKRRGRARDNKYAPFREYFKTMQHRRFKTYQQAGQKLTANGFVEWFLTNLPEDIKNRCHIFSNLLFILCIFSKNKGFYCVLCYRIENTISQYFQGVKPVLILR